MEQVNTLQLNFLNDQEVMSLCRDNGGVESGDAVSIHHCNVFVDDSGLVCFIQTPYDEAALFNRDIAYQLLTQFGKAYPELNACNRIAVQCVPSGTWFIYAMTIDAETQDRMIYLAVSSLRFDQDGIDRIHQVCVNIYNQGPASAVSIQ